MQSSEVTVTEKLDKLFKEDEKEYMKYALILKNAGFTIFRNSEGKHKVIYDHNYIYKAYGGIFRGPLNG